MFDQAFLDAQKVKLEEKKKNLLDAISGVATPDDQHHAKGDFDPKYPNVGDEEDENAQEVAQYQNNISAEAELEQDLKNVEDALKKIESGSYGICEETGKPIRQERLEAFPEARTCHTPEEKESE